MSNRTAKAVSGAKTGTESLQQWLARMFELLEGAWSNFKPSEPGPNGEAVPTPTGKLYGRELKRMAAEMGRVKVENGIHNCIRALRKDREGNIIRWLPGVDELRDFCVRAQDGRRFTHPQPCPLCNGKGWAYVRNGKVIPFAEVGFDDHTVRRCPNLTVDAS